MGFWDWHAQTKPWEFKRGIVLHIGAKLLVEAPLRTDEMRQGMCVCSCCCEVNRHTNILCFQLHVLVRSCADQVGQVTCVVCRDAVAQIRLLIKTDTWSWCFSAACDSYTNNYSKTGRSSWCSPDVRIYNMLHFSEDAGISEVQGQNVTKQESSAFMSKPIWQRRPPAITSGPSCTTATQNAEDVCPVSLSSYLQRCLQIMCLFMIHAFHCVHNSVNTFINHRL